MLYHKEGDGMLSHIVTGDETWVSHITPESKQQSLHCTMGYLADLSGQKTIFKKSMEVELKVT
jgi:hypothetical protein